MFNFNINWQNFRLKNFFEKKLIFYLQNPIFIANFATQFRNKTLLIN